MIRIFPYSSTIRDEYFFEIYIKILSVEVHRSIRKLMICMFKKAMVKGTYYKNRLLWKPIYLKIPIVYILQIIDFNKLSPHVFCINLSHFLTHNK